MAGRPGYLAAFYQSLYVELEKVLREVPRIIMAPLRLPPGRYNFRVVWYRNPSVKGERLLREKHFLASIFELQGGSTKGMQPLIQLDTPFLALEKPHRCLVCRTLDEAIYLVAKDLLRDFAARNFGACVEWSVFPKDDAMPPDRRLRRGRKPRCPF